jgi:hypothetical protein
MPRYTVRLNVISQSAYAYLVCIKDCNNFHPTMKKFSTNNPESTIFIHIGNLYYDDKKVVQYVFCNLRFSPIVSIITH